MKFQRKLSLLKTKLHYSLNHENQCGHNKLNKHLNQGMEKPNEISTVLAGVAGEYFVAAELSRRGFIASISLRNTRGVDVLATDEKAKRQVTLQCKTTRSKHNSWIISDKCEKDFSDKHFYIFVSLGKPLERPRFFIVPSKDVAKFSAARHNKWISSPKRDGITPRKTNSMRIFEDKEGRYLEKWELLGL